MKLELTADDKIIFKDLIAPMEQRFRPLKQFKFEADMNYLGAAKIYTGTCNQENLMFLCTNCPESFKHNFEVAILSDQSPYIAAAKCIYVGSYQESGTGLTKRRYIMAINRPEFMLNERLYQSDKPPLTLIESLQIAEDIISGLEFLHKRGKSHPRLSLYTISLYNTKDANYRAALIDFSSIDLISSLPHEIKKFLPSMEQADLRLPPQSNIFSFGLVLAGMLLIPLPRQLDPKNLESVLQSKPYPSQLRELIIQCVQPEAKKRPTASQVKIQLQEIRRLISPSSDFSKEKKYLVHNPKLPPSLMIQTSNLNPIPTYDSHSGSEISLNTSSEASSSSSSTSSLLSSRSSLFSSQETQAISSPTDEIKTNPSQEKHSEDYIKGKIDLLTEQLENLHAQYDNYKFAIYQIEGIISDKDKQEEQQITGINTVLKKLKETVSRSARKSPSLNNSSSPQTSSSSSSSLSSSYQSPVSH